MVASCVSFSARNFRRLDRMDVPMIVTGLVGAAPVLLNTGTVTRESLIINSCPASDGSIAATGLSAPAMNSKGAVGGLGEATVSPWSAAVWVRQLTANASFQISSEIARNVDICRAVARDRRLDATGNAFLIPGSQALGYKWAVPGLGVERSLPDHRDNTAKQLAWVVACSAAEDRLTVVGVVVVVDHPSRVVSAMAPVAGVKI